MFAPGAPPMFEDISNAIARLVASSLNRDIPVIRERLHARHHVRIPLGVEY